MGKLSELAHQDKEIAGGVSNFICEEAPYNLLKMIIEAAKTLPFESLDDETRAAGESEYEIFNEEDEGNLNGDCEHSKPTACSE